MLPAAVPKDALGPGRTCLLPHPDLPGLICYVNSLPFPSGSRFHVQPVVIVSHRGHPYMYPPHSTTSIYY